MVRLYRQAFYSELSQDLPYLNNKIGGGHSYYIPDDTKYQGLVHVYNDILNNRKLANHYSNTPWNGISLEEYFNARKPKTTGTQDGDEAKAADAGQAGTQAVTGTATATAAQNGTGADASTSAGAGTALSDAEREARDRYIPYDRSLDSAYYDALYKDGSDYMNALGWILDNPGSGLAKDLLSNINSGKYGSVNGNVIDGTNFKRLATDSRKGPVHNALIDLTTGKEPLWRDAKYGFDGHAPWRGRADLPEFTDEGKAGAAALQNAAQERVAADTTDRIKPGGDLAGDISRPKHENDPLGRTGDGLLPTWMRYAPAWSSALGLLNPQLYRRDYANANIFRNFANSLPDRKVRFRENLQRIRANPVDRNYQANALNANTAAALRGLNGTNAGGNAAATAAVLNGANANLGNMYTNTALTNSQLMNTAAQLNAQIKAQNSQGSFSASQANAQLGQARDALRAQLYGQYAQYREASDNGRNRALSTTINQLARNLGNIGTENYWRNAITSNSANRYVNGINGENVYRPPEGAAQAAASGTPFPAHMLNSGITSPEAFHKKIQGILDGAYLPSTPKWIRYGGRLTRNGR